MRFADGDLPIAGWHKSSYSGSQTECVEVARAPQVVGVRDTKHQEAGALALSAVAWRAFLTRT